MQRYYLDHLLFEIILLNSSLLFYAYKYYHLNDWDSHPSLCDVSRNVWCVMSGSRPPSMTLVTHHLLHHNHFDHIKSVRITEWWNKTRRCMYWVYKVKNKRWIIYCFSKFITDANAPAATGAALIQLCRLRSVGALVLTARSTSGTHSQDSSKNGRSQGKLQCLSNGRL